MNSDWPAIPLEPWRDTYANVHMWTQVVGKICLALTPRSNHYWNIAFQLQPTGLLTPAMPYGRQTFSIQFDFLTHELLVTCTSASAGMRLEPMTVAEFYKRLFVLLRGMGIEVKIWPVPVEVPNPIPFAEDTRYSAYDSDAVERWWAAMLSAKRVLDEFRCGFVGKCSPVHFFWGSFDLAVTRFSGRRAPAKLEMDALYAEAYSHEVISHGFWPGSGPVQEAAFYSYAAPEPSGFSEARIQPAAAYYHPELKEFILPYESVRTAANPEGDLGAFLHSTYNAGADLGHWDRADLER